MSMIHLSQLPAFGWETALCHANEASLGQALPAIKEKARIKAYKEISKYYPKGGSFPWMYASALFEANRQRIEGELIKREKSSAHIFRNIKKLVGYAPIFGSIYSYFRLKKVLNTETATLSNKRMHVLRHAIELTSCGMVLLPIDLGVTLYRLNYLKSGYG